MIEVLFQTESHFPVKRQKIKDAVIASLTGRISGNVEVSVIIVGDRRMKQLNTKYRNLEDTTDVLSFPQDDPSQKMHPFVNAPDGVLRLGDIVVSYPQAVHYAALEHTFVDEKITELVLHGLEHLMGNHHPE